MKWGLMGKGDIAHVAKEADWIANHLESLGETVHCAQGIGSHIGRSGRAAADVNADVDLWVTVGGDGTILRAQAITEKPVLGINAGAIGFLAEVEPPQAKDAIQAVLDGKHRIEERHKLACLLDGEPLPDAVNEITLQTRRIAKLIRFRVDVDGETMDTYRGDGIIVSTPTGSTGYAMSVGGPLVHPGVSGTILAPIAPFKLAARPWVVPSASTIDIKLLERDSAQGIQQARVVVDGQKGHDVATGATLRVTPSEHKARYIRLGSGFYERVRTKLTR